MIVVSACLLGVNCKYSGGNNLSDNALNLGRHIVPVCPEQLGGLSTPRPPAEIVGGDGHDVLAGKAKVLTSTGKDVTKCFIDGAEATALLAEITGAQTAVLKANSPSCGVNHIYDGTFSHCKRSGDGVTAALLKQRGLKIITEEEL
jgi:uncharacterized protein YbbK (DUF523 family)